jgi:hypothetical protein
MVKCVIIQAYGYHKVKDAVNKNHNYTILFFIINLNTYVGSYESSYLIFGNIQYLYERYNCNTAIPTF